MTEAAVELEQDEPLPSGTAKEHQIFQGLVYNLAEALRCFTALLIKPPSPEAAQVATAAFTKLVVLKKDLRMAQLSSPLIRPAGRTQPVRVAGEPSTYIPAPSVPDPVTDAMHASAWLLESIHQLMAMPNRLTRVQRDAALDLSDALTDFVPVAAVLMGRASD